MASLKTFIREARLTDAAMIARIEERCFERPQERFDVEKIRALLANRRTVAWVTESYDKTIVAWAAGFTRTHRSPRWGRIYALAVDPAAQGSYVGRQLFKALLEMMRLQGAEEFYLEVRPDNERAIQLYRKCGFTDCRVLPDFYAPGVHGQRMVLRD